MKGHFIEGIKDGVPIALGYLSVSFSIGIMALASGLNVFQGALMSLTNVTSAGQFAGIAVIASGGTLLELILTQLIINLRYALMSLSLSQKLPETMPLWKRMVIAFANTDEIFAVAMSHAKSLTFSYMVGLQSLPVLGWTGGTILGAVAGQVLPPAISSALSVALYGMFIAVVVPVAAKIRPVLWVVVLAAFFSCVLYYIPLFSGISTGISIIICTVLASVIGAFFFPVTQESDEKEE
ncbi:MAG: AzlC family ABC transporter permease [Lachnospiraceae bacterium]|nr:AzlC family ABC transporter permease [Lachnospiraceae bacterium]